MTTRFTIERLHSSRTFHAFSRLHVRKRLCKCGALHGVGLRPAAESRSSGPVQASQPPKVGGKEDVAWCRVLQLLRCRPQIRWPVQCLSLHLQCAHSTSFQKLVLSSPVLMWMSSECTCENSAFQILHISKSRRYRDIAEVIVEHENCAPSG